MNEKKTVQVVLRDDGRLAIIDPDSIYNPRRMLCQDDVKALRTYFQEERDEELTRWRDPLNSDMVCFPITENEIRVLNERDCRTRFVHRYLLSHVYDRCDDIDLQSCNPYIRTAKRYFEAHPPKKLWEYAEEGEYWLVTWSHTHMTEPCVVVSVNNKLYFQGSQQARDTSSEYIRHAKKLVVEEN